MKKIAIMAGSGVGKTSVIDELSRNPLLQNFKIGDIDTFLPFEKIEGISPEDIPKHWDSLELEAANKAVSSGVDIIFGVMTSKSVREFFEDRGYTLYALVVPQEIQLERIKKREKETGKKVNVPLSLSGNQQLMESKFPKIDGNREISEITADIVGLLGEF